MKHFFYLLITSFFLFVSVITFASDRPELGHAVYTYGACNEDPLEVNVLRYGKKTDKTFLVQITGVDHDISGEMLIYRVEELESTKLKYRFVNRKDDTLMSSLLFNGGDSRVDLYIRRYAGLYTPTGRLPENYSRSLCLIDTTLDPLQFHRRLEQQEERRKLSNG